MFYLQSNSEFLSDQLISLFQQKDIHFTLDPNEPVFACISFDQNNQKLSCSLDDQTIHLTLPQHSHFYSQLHQLFGQLLIRYTCLFPGSFN